MARAAAISRNADTIRERLLDLARNLHWTWQSKTRRLFEGLDPHAWNAAGRNPIAVIEGLTPQRLPALAGDAAFLESLADCERDRRDYLGGRSWFTRAAVGPARKLKVAYFCSEYAIDDCMPQFAGGLGVLAGDHLKSASDLGVPLVAVGLLYRCGYYQQQLLADGSTRVIFPRFDFSRWPIEDTGIRVRVPIGARSVDAAVWRARVGRVDLFLLDSDVKTNRPADRRLTEALYIGSDDVRIRQQIILGIGGVLALEKLGVKPTVYHLNEGHAAFCQLQRLRNLVARRVPLLDAIEALRDSTVFTTHTPVPAGNQRFANRLVLKTLGPLAAQLGLERETFLGLAREDPGDRREPFCMTVLALRLSGRCNGVAALHGEVSRKMWMRVYNADSPDEVPIGHVTNGIHSRTWLAPEIEPLYERYLRPKWNHAGPDEDWWKNAGRIPLAEFWRVRNHLRARLVGFIREKLREQILRRFGPIDDLIAAARMFDENALTIGFARRFATYKRAPLIFQNARRIAAILGDRARPVQLVFAGKAHPADLGGQAFAREIYRHAASAGLRGRVVILENYDMQMGQMLTSGCDVWLNNPIRPQEASGTSGMKPPLHGGLNCSILDGWWPEAYDRRNGWVIGAGGTQPQAGQGAGILPANDRKPKSQAAQDRCDAESIYALLEKEIVPLFYRRDREGVPQGWVKLALRSMQSICAMFSTQRMLAEYTEQYYLPAHE